MRWGYFIDTFDPLTLLHLHAAEVLRHRFNLDKVLFAPYSSLRRDKKIFASNEHRLHMLYSTLNQNPYFSVDDQEIRSSHHQVPPLYQTLEEVKARYPTIDLQVIMGVSDLIDLGMQECQATRLLLERNLFLIVSRDDKDVEKILRFYPVFKPYRHHFQYVNFPEGFRSLTVYIQQEVQRGNPPRHLLPAEVYEYLIKEFIH